MGSNGYFFWAYCLTYFLRKVWFIWSKTLVLRINGVERIVQRESGPHHHGLQLGSGQIWTHMTWTDHKCYRLGLFDLYPAHPESWKPHKIWVRLDGYWEPKIGVPKSHSTSNGFDLLRMVCMGTYVRIIIHADPLLIMSPGNTHGSHANHLPAKLHPYYHFPYRVHVFYRVIIK